MDNHNFFMEKCIALGEKAMLNGNPPVGAIVVKDNKVLGIGMEAGKSSKDITKHAEIEAIKNALENSLNNNLSDCTLYTTHEPCIMCSYVLRHYKVNTIIYGTEVPHIGGITSHLPVLKTTEVPKWGNPPNIIQNVLKKECDNLSIIYKKALDKYEI